MRWNARRLLRHASLAAGGVGITLAVAAARADAPIVAQLSLGTAYAGLIYLALALIIGPINLVRNRPNPISGYVRRDVGIWAGVFAVVHTVLGLQVHLGGDIARYFLYPDGADRLVPVRYDPFGIANHTGLSAALVFLLLLALSNNLSLRRLGPRRWKALQRWAYVGAGLVLVHGLLYQLLERRTLAFAAVFLLIALAAATVQGLGIRARRRMPAPSRPAAA